MLSSMDMSSLQPHPDSGRRRSAARLLLFAYIPAAMSATEIPRLCRLAWRPRDGEHARLALYKEVVGLLGSVARPRPVP